VLVRATRFRTSVGTFYPRNGLENGSRLWMRGGPRPYERKVRNMAQPRDVRKHVEQLIERAQDEILEASRELAEGISKGTERYVPPISKDVERMVDEVFDFAERVMQGQRRMVNDVVKTINEQTDRAAEVGRATTKRATQKATKRVAAAKKAVGQRAPNRKSAAKRAPAKKAAAKRAPAKKAARKAPAKKTTARG
jgi:hypothetical protein